MNDYFEKIVNDFIGTLSCSRERISLYESIIRRLLAFLMKKGHNDFSDFNPMIISDFITEISIDRPKSMGDVICCLKKLFLHLNEKGTSIDFNILLLTCPKRYRRKVYPCMKIDEVLELLNHIDQTTSQGKRDYALLLLAATTGLRVGDLATLKLKDINWKRCEISIIQGKTKVPLVLPLNSTLRDALADYVLNGRPASNSPNIFLRFYAPYTEFANGDAVACILKSYLKSMGIERELDDGKTFRGIRRMLASKHDCLKSSSHYDCPSTRS